MLLLHAAWLPQTDSAPARLAVWGETDQPAVTRRRIPVAKRLVSHPFSAAPEALLAVLPEPAPNGEPARLAVRLPSTRAEPQPSRPWLRERPAKGRLTLAAWRVPALTFAPRDALALLLRFDDEDALADDVRFWQAAARAALDLLVSQRYVPALVAAGTGWAAVWRPLLDAPAAQAVVDRLVNAMPPVARALTRDENDPEPGPRALLTDFLNVTVDAVARGAATFGAQPRRAKPPASQKAASPAEQWLAALVAADPAVVLPAEFIAQYQAWAQPAPAAVGNVRLCFRLDPPAAPTTGDALVIPKATARDWTVRYFLQAQNDLSLLVPAERVWRERGTTLKFLNRQFEQPQEKLLAGLGLAARLFPPLEDSLRQARPEDCALTAAQAHTFIREAAVLLQGAGFGVLLPGLSTKLGVRLKLGPKRPAPKAPQGGVASLSFQRAIAFNWELALGDQPLSAAEFEQLAALKVPLVQLRGQWVEVRPEQLQQALDFVTQRVAAGALTLEEAMRLALASDSVAGLPIASVETTGWVGDLLGQLTDHARLTLLPTPPTLMGTLRPYQATGLAWLAFLRQCGLGACLADDMGLGKTIQTIALLLHLRGAAARARAGKPALLVCPTSVVGNWQREVARFAPTLSVLAHHGTGREKADFAQQARQHDLVLTSYALLHRDTKLLNAVAWGEVILDEAQNIKNPDTRQAKAARQLPAEHRIALTGTPVENRLSELWSLFQFLNPGYLGAQAQFRATFAQPIERGQDPEAARRLKALVGPLILRRVKTDLTVIQDLPAKNEMKVFCGLTREQATLYAAVVRDSLAQIEAAEGIQRRGLVLATLLKLKQVCNHPAQLLGDGSALPNRSGKLTRLVEMLEEARAVKERALIFTQFAEMGKLLRAHLQATFGDEVLFLHGGTPAAARTLLVERFQTEAHGPLVFVLSIKAGGTGLNLTRANHVFHFDRWWNPAVENQATDRAFRIGQTKNVQVYKYICAGTVEERVDEMIERKLALAESIVGTSEAWVTELNTTQLRELFALRAAEVS